MKNREYAFRSSWQIAAPLDAVWHVMTKTPFGWSDWWPELSDLKFIRQTPDLIGTEFSCRWRAPIGYKLYTDVVISQLDAPKQVRLETSGDLNGIVICTLSQNSGGTHIDIDWRVSTTQAWMNRLHPVLRPFFIWNHHAVMSSGENGLRAHMSAIKTAPEMSGAG